MRRITKQEVFDRVNFDSNSQREYYQLEYWVDNYGIERYMDLIDIVVGKNNKICYIDLKEAAKFDFNLATLLFGGIKDFEIMLKACICNQNNDKVISYTSMEELREGMSQLLGVECSALNKIKTEKCMGHNIKSLYHILAENSLGFSKIVYFAMPLEKQTIGVSKTELQQIVDLRNGVYHNNLLIGSDIVKAQIKTLYKYFKDGALKDNFDRKWALFTAKVNNNPSEKVRRFIFGL